MAGVTCPTNSRDSFSSAPAAKLYDSTPPKLLHRLRQLTVLALQRARDGFGRQSLGRCFAVARNLGDRLVMMHRGSVLHDFRGAEKRRLRADELLARFEDVRRADQLDESAAEMLRRLYV